MTVLLILPNNQQVLTYRKALPNYERFGYKVEAAHDTPGTYKVVQAAKE